MKSTLKKCLAAIAVVTAVAVYVFATKPEKPSFLLKSDNVQELAEKLGLCHVEYHHIHFLSTSPRTTDQLPSSHYDNSGAWDGLISINFQHWQLTLVNRLKSTEKYEEARFMLADSDTIAVDVYGDAELVRRLMKMLAN